MAGLVLYTLTVSPPCRAVELCIKALGLHVDRWIVDLLAGEHLKPEFVKLNPQHAVPVLDDNGTIITDSHAIMIYLVTMYGANGSELYPMEVVSQAKVHAGLHFNSSVLFPRMRFAFVRFITQCHWFFLIASTIIRNQFSLRLRWESLMKSGTTLKRHTNFWKTYSRTPDM